jgi:hypothetical protein
VADRHGKFSAANVFEGMGSGEAASAVRHLEVGGEIPKMRYVCWFGAFQLH